MLLALLPLSLTAGSPSGPDGMEPDGTYMFTQRDTCDLYLDIYGPAPGSETMYNGKRKPTILFVFGGGFISGSRAESYNLPWYRELTENITPRAQERNKFWKQHYQKLYEDKLFDAGLTPKQARDMWMSLIGRNYLDE